MTAFDRTKLPANITTLESLIAWSGAAFHKINKQATTVEGPVSPVKTAQFVLASIESTNQERAVFRQSLLLNPDHAIDKKPIWENVQELSNEAIPPEFF